MAAMKLFAVAFLIFFLIFGVLYFVPVEKETRGRITKIQLTCLAQLVLSMLSLFMWRRVKGTSRALSSANFVCSAAAVRGTLLVFFALVHFSFISWDSSYFTIPQTHPLTNLSFICLGIYIQLIMCLVIIDTLFFTLSFFKFKFSMPTDLKEYRKWKMLLSVALALVLGVCGVYNASRSAVIKYQSIPIEGLPKKLNNLRIVQICDLHIGPTIGASKIQDTVDAVNRLNPDIVVITGDLVDASVGQMLPVVQRLAGIKTKLGVYFVTGNHEYLSGHVDDWFAELRKIGIHVLHNSNVKIQLNPDDEEYLCLAGTDDIEAKRFRYGDHGMDLDAAVKSCDPKAPVVLLAHQPKAAKIALDSQYNIQLVLSGHTHGGQMLPMTLIAYLVNPFYAGHYVYKDRHVYVSQGTMFWGIPMRHFSTAEIAVITLLRASYVQ